MSEKEEQLELAMALLENHNILGKLETIDLLEVINTEDNIKNGPPKLQKEEKNFITYIKTLNNIKIGPELSKMEDIDKINNNQKQLIDILKKHLSSNGISLYLNTEIDEFFFKKEDVNELLDNKISEIKKNQEILAELNEILSKNTELEQEYTKYLDIETFQNLTNKREKLQEEYQKEIDLKKVYEKKIKKYVRDQKKGK